MVMQEAINDKTIQVQKQLKDQEGNFHDPSAKSDLLHRGHDHDEFEDEEFGDQEEEKIMRDIREMRMTQMKNNY
jgi:thiol-disulfide isomerase/thioredoxin